MLSNKLAQEDTTMSYRMPGNIMEHISNQSLGDDFVFLLSKHGKSLLELLDSTSEVSDVENAKFVIELNNFSGELKKLVEISSDIYNKNINHKNILEKNRKALRGYDSKKLAMEIGSLYVNARNYDEYFLFRNFTLNVNGKGVFPIFRLSQPFVHMENLSNEENIRNLILLFRLHADFFKNYLNVLYGDGKEGERFSGRSFESISTDYKKIINTCSDISKLISDSAIEEVLESIGKKTNEAKKIFEKYPSVLYLAINKLLLHIENSMN